MRLPFRRVLESSLCSWPPPRRASWARRPAAGRPAACPRGRHPRDPCRRASLCLRRVVYFSDSRVFRWVVAQQQWQEQHRPLRRRARRLSCGTRSCSPLAGQWQVPLPTSTSRSGRLPARLLLCLLATQQPLSSAPRVPLSRQHSPPPEQLKPECCHCRRWAQSPGSVGDGPEDGATFSAFAAAQAQRGAAVAVSLSDTMFASTASTAGRAPDTDAKLSVQSESGTAVHAAGSTGMSQSAGSSVGGGTGGEQAMAPAGSRGMPPRESMLSATDLVEHGQRASAAESQEAEVAFSQNEEAQPSVPAAAQLAVGEVPVAASVPAGQPQAFAEEGSGLQPVGEPQPPEDALSLRIAQEGAFTDAEPSGISVHTDAEQPGPSSASASASAAEPQLPSEPAADSAPSSTETQALQDSDAVHTAATAVPVAAVPLDSDVSGAASSLVAMESQQSNAEPIILATARQSEAGPASAHAAEPSPTADKHSDLDSGSVAHADSGMPEAPGRSQPFPAAEAAPTDRGGGELHDPGLAREEAGNVAARPDAAEPPRIEAEPPNGGQPTSAVAAALISDEGDDMLDAQSQHSEGSTISI